MRFLIFGAGAVGQALGCLLSCDGHFMDMIVRSRYLSTIRENGLTLTGISGDYSADMKSAGYYTSVDELPPDSVYDYVLVTTKTYGFEKVLREIELLDCERVKSAVSVQIGCESFEKLASRIGGEKSLAARISAGFEIEHPGLVRITANSHPVLIGGCIPGEVPETAACLSGCLNHAGLPSETTPNIKGELLAGLLFDCALNPLGAALGVSYGLLGGDRSALSIMSGIIRETFAVIGAMGEKTEWGSPEEYETYLFDELIPLYSDRNSSILYDIKNGNPTEIDALTGYVSGRGKLHDVPTAVSDTMTKLIRFMVRQVCGEERCCTIE